MTNTIMHDFEIEKLTPVDIADMNCEDAMRDAKGRFKRPPRLIVAYENRHPQRQSRRSKLQVILGGKSVRQG